MARHPTDVVMYCKDEVRMYRNHKGKRQPTLCAVLIRGWLSDTRMKRETWVYGCSQDTAHFLQGGKGVSGHGGGESCPWGEAISGGFITALNKVGVGVLS